MFWQNPKSRVNLLRGVSRTAVAAFVLGAGTHIALAQETSDSTAAPTPTQTEPATGAAAAGGQEIIVTGIRNSLQGALNAKKNSAQVLDAISAEDIGKFPDKNVGEALQRVTGVQLTRSDGEGSGVTIRGADPSLNRVEINGSTVLSTTVGGGRDVDFRDLPAEFVNRVEVVKSATPDMTEGGLGGTVRVITRKPFDNGGKPYLAGSAQTIVSELGETFDPKFALIGSDTFADKTIGVLLSGTYEDRSVESHQALTTGWRNVPDINGDGTNDFIPDIPRYVINRLKTERYALNGVIQYQPTDAFHAYVEGNYTHSTQTPSSAYLQTGTTGGIVDPDNTVVGPDDTVTHVELTNNTSLPIANQLGVSYRNIVGTINRSTYNVATGFDWKAGDFTFTPKISYAHARAYNNEIDVIASAVGIPSLIVDYDNPQHAPNIILPFDPRSTEGINQLQVAHKPRYNTQSELNTQFDVNYEPVGSFITSIKAGVQRRRVEADSRYYSDAPTIDGTVDPSLIPQIQDYVAQYGTYGDVPFFKTGDLGFNGLASWYNLGQDLADAVGVPDASDNQVFNDTWKVRETNLAGYLQAAFEFDAGFPISGVLGARVVNTKTISSGFRSTTGTGSAAPVVTPVRFDGEDTEFLPSLNLKASIIPDKLIARATASEVIARPLPQQLAPRFSTDIVGLTGSRGNPDLEPFRARQYDLGAEYYLNRTSYLSIDYFRKEISSFIQNNTQPEIIDGVEYTITIPTNGSQKVTINGIEAGAQVAFDFLTTPILKNMGVIANYTYSKDSGYEGKNYFTGDSLPFPGLSRNSYNISVYYEDPTFSIRGSYNWRSNYLITAIGRGNSPEFGESYGQLDGSVNVNLNDKFAVFLEGVNILDATRAQNADSVYRRTLLETFGRRVYAGVRVRF